MWTLLGCGNPSVLEIKRHSSAVLSMHVRTNLAAGCVMRGEESVGEATGSINIVDCIHRLILRSNISGEDLFSAMSMKTVPIIENLLQSYFCFGRTGKKYSDKAFFKACCVA